MRSPTYLKCTHLKILVTNSKNYKTSTWVITMGVQITYICGQCQPRSCQFETLELVGLSGLFLLKEFYDFHEGDSEVWITVA